MSVNRYRPHLYVIPEDDRDRQIANGFELHQSVNAQQIQVVEPAGGWRRVLDVFIEEYVPLLQQNDNAHVVMLIDFDGIVQKRRSHFDSQIPESLRDRVFVVGPRDTPEALKQALGASYESIGRDLADECDRDTWSLWTHEQLQHNNDERRRLVHAARPFLLS